MRSVVRTKQLIPSRAFIVKEQAEITELSYFVVKLMIRQRRVFTE